MMRAIAFSAFVVLVAASSFGQSPCGASPRNPCWIGGATPADVYHAPDKWPEIAADAAWGASAAADVMLSHRCIERGACHEGNPLLSDRVSITVPLIAAETLAGMWMFHRARRRTKLAWLIPAANAGMHLAAIAH